MTETTTATAIAVEAEPKKISPQKERMNELNAQIEQGILDVTGGEKFKDYLDVTAKFSGLGYGNNVLVMQQNPEATQLAGFNAWQKSERFVKRDETGIKIFAPDTFVAEEEKAKVHGITKKPVIDSYGVQEKERVQTIVTYFKPVTVFDVSQTYGKRLPKQEIPELDGNVEDYGLLFNAVKESYPYYKIELAEIPNGGKGNCNYKDKIISINENMSEDEIIRAAVQGVTLTAIHDTEQRKPADTPPKDRETTAIETEAVTYTVCKRYGVEPPILDVSRVAAWSADKDMEEMKSLLKSIHNKASDLIKGIDEKIIVAVKAQEITANIPDVPPPPEMSEKPHQSAIFGNTDYKDISDKKFLIINNEDVQKIVAELEAQGIKYSGKERDNGKTSLTVEMADYEAVQKIEKSINIIGNTPFKDLVERNYFEHDINTAQKIAAELETQGVNFSGRIKRNKITLTVGAADVEQFKAIEQAIVEPQLAAEIPAQSEIVSFADFAIGNSQAEMPVDIPPPPEPPEKSVIFPEPAKSAEAEKPAAPDKAEKTAPEKAEKPKRAKKSINSRIKEGTKAEKSAQEKPAPTRKPKKEQEIG